MTTHIFANPRSGLLPVEKKQKLLSTLATATHAHLHGFDLSSAQELRDMIQAETKRGDTIYIAGGDGTLVDGFNAVTGKNAVVIPVPMGTGCAMRSEFKMPHLRNERSVDAFLARMRKARPRSLDLIAVEDELTIWASIGIEGDICHRYAQFPVKGVNSYLFVGAMALLQHQPFHVQLQQDGRTRELETQALMATKFQYYGNGLRVMPAARHHDGRMYLAARPYTLIGTPYETLNAKLGRLHPEFWTAREVVLTADREVKLQAAGDYKRSAREFSLRVVPNAVTVLY